MTATASNRYTPECTDEIAHCRLHGQNHSLAAKGCLTEGEYNVPNRELSGTELDIFWASVIDRPQVEQETFREAARVSFCAS
jgi:hypothetical protein